MTFFVLAVFAAVYLGMALGRWPGLKVDRTGIALLGALLLFGGGAIDEASVLAAIDFPTIAILFGLMVLSAQFAASGFYDWAAGRVASSAAAPGLVLGLVVVTAGGLSAVLANDVVVFAMTPMLCRGLIARGWDPRPFLIALAGAANAGSAATVIGNPQNVLIGQVGGLDFWPFLVVCGLPALFALLAVYVSVWVIWRGRLRSATAVPPAAGESPPLDRGGVAKGGLATLLLLGLFLSPLPAASSVLLVAGLLLISRRLATRQMLSLVDWHLLVLFAGLFVVTACLAATGLPDRALEALGGGADALGRLALLAPISLAGSNSIGNVPLVMLLLSSAPGLSDGTYYALALFSTLAGNLLLVGSLANIIVVERAAQEGVRLGFLEHARCGVPMTLLSFAGAAAWLLLTGAIRL
ncbi:MAG: SLC13 family permease [Kiloniellales bacterium]